MLGHIGDAFSMAFAMFWEILWALILGFSLSAVVQAVVSKSEMSRALPGQAATDRAASGPNAAARSRPRRTRWSSWVS